MKNKKSLGQNWLKDRAILEQIADISADLPEDFLDKNLVCLEIGPGLGTLTSSLLKHFDKVIAVEFDESLAKNLPNSFPGKNLEVVNSDILEFDLAKLPSPYVVAGNIPYYITTPILKKLLTPLNKPEKITLLVQKEVAEKIGNPKESSSLSLFVENLAEISLGPVVKRELFTPAPKVDSQVLVLTPRPQKKYDKSTEVIDLIVKAFKNPRKKLATNLSGYNNYSKQEIETILSSLKINKNARPSDLNLDNYATLAKSLKKR
ncbi:ribosomal RNA small subunit methyltransferase A [Candidatus Saccharibacteria bacterium]|nr:ribosomal RNA small subunit methyltransferase A [Candidatus Saccharibacteria bacterium]